MKRALVVLLVLALVGGTVTPSWAGPGEWVALTTIIDALHDIYATMGRINDVLRTTRDTLNAVYPAEALQEIKQVFTQVRSIEDEIKAISCDWNFSVGVQRFWDGVFAGKRLCKPEWQAVFGSPPASVMKDLDEYYDYQGVRRMNMVASRVASEKEHQDFLAWLFAEAEKGRDPDADLKYGPGYSQRLSALGASALGNLLLEQGDTLTAELELAQERANDSRFRKRLQTEFAVDLFAELAGESPLGGAAQLAALAGAPQ